MGAPGSGKTTIGHLLSLKLRMGALDIDNDYLEAVWHMSVATKLKELGDEQFLQAEGVAVMSIPTKEDHVIALTGSNPLHPGSMHRLRKLGILVYL